MSNKYNSSSLSLRTGPDLEFIIKEQRLEFEQHVIDLYFASLQTVDIFPMIREDILMHSDPKFLFAGALDLYTEEKGLFLKETKGMSEIEINYFSSSNLNHLQKQVGLSEAMYEFDLDAYYVLDYHHMSFIDQHPLNQAGKAQYVIRNLPFTVIW